MGLTSLLGDAKSTQVDNEDRGWVVVVALAFNHSTWEAAFTLGTGGWQYNVCEGTALGENPNRNITGFGYLYLCLMGFFTVSQLVMR